MFLTTLIQIDTGSREHRLIFHHAGSSYGSFATTIRRRSPDAADCIRNQHSEGFDEFEIRDKQAFELVSGAF